jgi:hypothetical protein
MPVVSMKRFLREPLLHFLLLGAGLFFAYGLVSKHASGEPGKIVVSRGQIEHLVVGFMRTWQRPPAAEELDCLIRDYVREEIYFREAIAFGLDKNDIVIRHRLQQKLQFITEDVAAQLEPTEEQLRTYLKAHPDTFRVEERFTFKQIYLNPQLRRDNLARDAQQLLARLQTTDAKIDVSNLGDALLLEHDFNAVPASEITRQFGDKFVAKLGELPTGQWQGPIESGFGAHLVYVSDLIEGRIPSLAEVRGAVRREWANAQRQKANEQFYAGLLKRYTVIIESPQPVNEPKRVAKAK